MTKEAVIEEARGWKAKAQGLQAALDLHRITEHGVRLDKARVERELASTRMELEELKLWFAQAKSQGADVPVALTIRQLDAWRKLS